MLYRERRRYDGNTKWRNTHKQIEGYICRRAVSDKRAYHLIARHAEELKFHIGGTWPTTETNPRYTCRSFRRRPTQHRTEAHCRPQQRQREPHTRVSVYLLSGSRRFLLANCRGDGQTVMVPSLASPFAIFGRCRANLRPDTAHPPMSKVCRGNVYPPKNPSSRASERTEVIAARSAIVATKNGSGRKEKRSKGRVTEGRKRWSR